MGLGVSVWIGVGTSVAIGDDLFTGGNAASGVAEGHDVAVLEGKGVDDAATVKVARRVAVADAVADTVIDGVAEGGSRAGLAVDPDRKMNKAEAIIPIVMIRKSIKAPYSTRSKLDGFLTNDGGSTVVSTGSAETALETSKANAVAEE
jgi:hypothetical protein